MEKLRQQAEEALDCHQMLEVDPRDVLKLLDQLEYRAPSLHSNKNYLVTEGDYNHLKQ